MRAPDGDYPLAAPETTLLPVVGRRYSKFLSGILPLAAMATGLLGRADPDWDGWLSVLERHVARSEDPAIWTALLLFRGDPLFLADRVRALHLVQTIWEKFPDAFSDKDIADFLWRNREMVGNEVMRAIRDCWLISDDATNRQAAGELLMAAVLVDPEDGVASEQLEQILAGTESSERLGALFTAATAWLEDSPGLRSRAHGVLCALLSRRIGMMHWRSRAPYLIQLLDRLTSLPKSFWLLLQTILRCCVLV